MFRFTYGTMDKKFREVTGVCARSIMLAWGEVHREMMGGQSRRGVWTVSAIDPPLSESEHREAAAKLSVSHPIVRDAA